MGIYNVVTDWKEDTTLDIHVVIALDKYPTGFSVFSVERGVLFFQDESKTGVIYARKEKIFSQKQNCKLEGKESV